MASYVRRRKTLRTVWGDVLGPYGRLLSSLARAIPMLPCNGLSLTCVSRLIYPTRVCRRYLTTISEDYALLPLYNLETVRHMLFSFPYTT